MNLDRANINQNTSAVGKVRFAACECPAEESRALRPVLGTATVHRVQVKAHSLHGEDAHAMISSHSHNSFFQRLCAFQWTRMDLPSLPNALINDILGYNPRLLLLWTSRNFKSRQKVYFECATPCKHVQGTVPRKSGSHGPPGTCSGTAPSTQPLRIRSLSNSLASCVAVPAAESAVQ